MRGKHEGRAIAGSASATLAGGLALCWLLTACTTETTEFVPPAKDSFDPPPLDLSTMVAIGAGTFSMGHPDDDPGDYGKPWKENEMPAHDVTLGAFWIDADEVTAEQYALFLSYAAGEKHYSPFSPIERLDDGTYAAMVGWEQRPANYVTWLGAAEYCQWLGKRLPTEAEWERAAKGSEHRNYPWGDEGPNCTRANYYTGRTYCAAEPLDIGSHSPDGDAPEGARDMAGNVAEWTADYYGPYSPEPATDPTGPAETWEGRVVRGGGFDESAAAIRTTARWAAVPDKSSAGIGFRCAYREAGVQP